MLSCLGRAYHFARHGDRTMEAVPSSVLKEMMLVVSLLPGLAQDLRLPWSSCIHATDGAQCYGFGGVTAKCDPSLSRSLASASREEGMSFVLSDTSGRDEQKIYEIPLTSHVFNIVFSLPSRIEQPACKMEMDAMTIMIQHLARSARKHRERVFCLVDSQPLRYALLKGRSGAPHFRFGSRRIAAMLIATEIQLHVGYTPSRANAADPPSRGLKGASSKGRERRRGDYGQGCKRTLQALHDIKGAYRRCIAYELYHVKRARCRGFKSGLDPSWCEQLSWDSTCSSSQVGQPSL